MDTGGGGAERRLRRRGGRSGRGQGSKKLGAMGVANVRPLTYSSTHTLHSLRKWLVRFSKNPTGMQGGARGLLQQLHSKLTQLGWGRDGHTQVDTQCRHKWNVTYLSIVQ